MQQSLFFILTASFASAIGAFLMRQTCWHFGLVAPHLTEKKSWRWVPPLASSLATTALILSPLRNNDMYATIAYCFYISFLAALSSIDLEEKLIPQGIWVIGTILAIFISAAVPKTVGQTYWYSGLEFSLIGAAVGAGLILFMVEFGKLLFGKVVLSFKKPVKYRLFKGEHDWAFECDGETLSFFEMFFRKKDVLVIEKKEADGVSIIKVWEHHIVDTAGRRELEEMQGELVKVTVPREAMGFGDVKFMCMAGAMTGWEGAVFSIFAGAVIGTVIGVIIKALKGHTEVPFIPFLAGGMMVFFILQNAVRNYFIF